jgi:hypothetical protein
LLARRAGVPLAYQRVITPAARLGGLCETVLTRVAGPTRLEIGLAVVAIAVPAAVADLFELAAALLSLATALAVFVDGFLQIVFRLLDVTATLVIALGTGGYRHSG